MSDDDLKDFYRRYVDLANTRDFGRLEEFVHEDVTMNGEPGTRDAMTASLRGFTELMPDLVWKIQDLVVEGNRIAARLLDRGTPQQEWFGVTPTGVTVEFTEVAFYEVRDGRFEHTTYLMDAEAVRRQLGG